MVTMINLIRTYSLCKTCLNLKPISNSGFTSYFQARLAGHAKWQNIKHTKTANDLSKCKLISRYVMMVRRAIMAGNRQTDPKLNPKLAEVLSEAGKLNVPKATLERAIVRAQNLKIYGYNLDIQGPGRSSVIVRVETDSINVLRRDIKKILRKYDSTLMPEESLINMFRSQGFLRTSTKTKDEREISQDFAEEAAILANAQDVYEEGYDDAEDPSLTRQWVFVTDAESLNPCKGELEKQGFKIFSSTLELVPYHAVEFGVEVTEKIDELQKALMELDQVVEVYSNATPMEQN